MQDYGHIRRMYLVDGLSQRQIAEKLGISRNTVAKYCEGNTYPGLRASYCRAASVMTPDILRFIEQCLHEDRLEPNQKQHHTAKRIYERLVEEKSFTAPKAPCGALSPNCADILAKRSFPSHSPRETPCRSTGAKPSSTWQANARKCRCFAPALPTAALRSPCASAGRTPRPSSKDSYRP